MISITGKGDLSKTKAFLTRLSKGDVFKDLDHYGRLGVEALASATPVDTGITADSWKYRVFKNKRGPAIQWYNTNHKGNTSVVILIQYGHGTGTGGYVQGRDFINPVIQPLFDKISDDVWKKVKA